MALPNPSIPTETEPSVALLIRPTSGDGAIQLIIAYRAAICATSRSNRPPPVRVLLVKPVQEETSMPLPHDALVLVADGRKMLFFRNQGDENQIDLRIEAHEARTNQRKDRDIKTDAPGTVKQSFGFGRSTYEEPDFQQQEEDRWIKDAADELKTRVLRGDFEALAIVAPPKALGVLKKCLHKEVERRIMCTVNKEMSGRPIPDIEALITGETQASLPTG